MVGVIGGTGLGEALFGHASGTAHDIDTPFGKPSTPIRVVNWNGLDVALLARHGEGHSFSPTQVPYRANIYALKSVGCTHIIASGAVGSLREEIKPRDLVVVDQVIDRTFRREPTFFDEGLAVHVEFAEPFCLALRNLLLSVKDDVDATVHERGTYVCMEGPAFSSTAESQMHRGWGADIVGMTSMPEAKLAREAEMSYALVALVTDFDCWRPRDESTDRQELLAEIIGHLEVATRNASVFIRAALEKFAAKPLGPSPIHSVLDLALWTDKSKITPELCRRYGVLLERYMDEAARH
jgi:5'-methylthioadenosine phosphorylase